MDQLSRDDARHDSVSSRRSSMRSVARSRRGVTSTLPDAFRTPAWLERSFVLPLTKPEQADAPGPRSHHDPIPQQADPRQMSTQSSPAGNPGSPTPAFVRPPSDEIDFSTVIRRADLSRAALRTAWVSTGVAGLVLIAFLLTALPAVAAVAAVAAVVAVSATVVRIRLTRAPVPRVNR